MTSLVGYLLLFTVVGVLFLLVTLLVGKLLRPYRPSSEKLAVYECGEPTIGASWVQFDLRFYVVALLFIIFDVEVAFFFPWAAVFGQANQVATASSEQLQRYLPVAPGISADGEADRATGAGLVSSVGDEVSRALFDREAIERVVRSRPKDPVVQRNLAAQRAAELRAGQGRAHQLALIAFVDILVFFGVLLVGFAYVWKRGDLDWVRAIGRQPVPAAETEPVGELVEVG